MDKDMTEEQKTKARAYKDVRIPTLLSRLGIAYPTWGFYIGDGWLPIVENALERMIVAGWDRNLAQVKQKFGGLRIYIGYTNEAITRIIREAESACDKACEHCGALHGLEVPLSGLALCKECRDKDN